MADNLYNGVSLPALPEYDTAGFPFAYIARNAGESACVLTLAEQRPVYGPDPEDSTANSVYHYGMSQSYIVDGGAWVLQAEVETLVHIREDVGAVIWTNTEILKTDGSIYLAASDPITGNWLRSFKTGLALGLCGKPLPFVEKEPVEYLYNGVRLPKPPEWDKTAYPFAAISYRDTTDGRVYYFFAHEFQHYWSRTLSLVGTTNYYGSENGSPKAVLYMKYESDKNWAIQEKTDWNLAIDKNKDYSDPVVWTNFDLKYADGSSYCKASEPVPVYE